ncbi:MAG: sodium/proline symporter PutP [Oscillospiraceae bacterium]|nr:sodium/proline symporter PutP [Oscillospiraceae bacterium]
MTSEQILMLVTIGGYLVLVLLIGVWCSKRNNTVDDFYLGGRQLGPFVTAMSAEASDMSSWLLMGLPGVAYATGLADATWTAIGLAVGTYLNWLIVAKRLRNYSHVCNNSITIPDFFSNRYRDKHKILMAVAALIIIVFFVPYTASGFAACGKLFSALFGIDYHLAMIISAVVIVGYTSIGGFFAASTTDFIQGIVMTIALFIVFGFGITVAGGPGAVIENASALPGYLSMGATYNAETNSANPYGILTIISTLAWGLGYFGMPHVLLRFMAIDDSRKLKTSRRVASIWVVISLAVAICIGVIGLGMVSAGAMPALSDPETIIVNIADLLGKNGWLAALVGGLILAGILASTMSTADSQLLAASSSVSENIIGGLFRIKTSKKVSMVIAKITLVAIAAVAVLLAWDKNSSVFQIVSFAWAGFGATFGPVVLLALFWKRSTMWGALSGMVVGGAMVFIWKYLLAPLGGVLNIYELLPAFLAAIIVNVIVSLLTKKPSQDVIDEFEAVKAMK